MPDTVQVQRDFDKETCSCDHCLDGWLSPRMKERLRGMVPPISLPSNASHTCLTDEADNMRYASLSLLEDLDKLPEDEVIPDWVIAADDILHYIPMELHIKMSPSFYRGFVLVFDAMVQVLRRDTTEPGSCIPTPAAINTRLKELRIETKPTAVDGDKVPSLAMSPGEVSDVERFIAAGGKVEFTLEALTDRAMVKSPIGSEYRRRRALREEEEEFEMEIKELPICDNDLDFELVRFKLGLQPTGIGPHWFFLTDSEDEDENENEGGGDDEFYEPLQADKYSAIMRRRE